MEELINQISILLKGWLKKNEFLQLEKYIQLILLLLVFIVFPLLKKIVLKIFKFFREENLKKDLSPIIGKSEVQEATRYFVPTKFQNISPSEEHEPIYSLGSVAKNELIPFFIKNAFKVDKNSEKYYLVLADSGMGKSTFLINLYLQYQNKFWTKRDKMIFAPLGQIEIDNIWNQIPSSEQGKTILMLDAFDEDPRAESDYKSRLDAILLSTRGFKKVIITSRTQFFLNEKSEPSHTNIFKYSLNGNTSHYFKKLYISPFDDQDIKTYLNLKYPFWNLWTRKKRRKAKEIIRLCPNLMVRPMLLSYIDLLIENGSNDIENSIINSSTDLYEKLIDRWIERESNRVPLDRKEEFKENMYKFSLNLSIYLYEKAGIGGELVIDSNRIIEIANNFSIKLSELELRGRSLLNRDNIGCYKFAHKSILEYFLAKHAFDDASFANGVYMFRNLEGFDQARKFYEEMNERYFSQ